MFQSDTNNTTLTKIKQASLFYGPTLETRPNNSVPLLTRPNTPQGTKTAAALPKEKEDDNIQRGSRLLLLLRTLLISCILTIALVYFMPTQKKSNEGGMARIEQQTENLKVSLHNPKWDEQEAGKVILNQYNSTFDPTTQAKNMNINIASRHFAYINNPRKSLGSSYRHAPQRAAGERSHVGSLGIRPIPNEQGRYHSQDSLEWQGNWELDNPQANIERGSSYIKYLRNKFSNNLKENLSTRKLHEKKIQPPLPSVAKPKIPILSYQN